MGLSGLEPPTSRLSGVRSNRLSYKPIFVAHSFECLTNGDGEIRTLDPLLARQVLSQLSYTPIGCGSSFLFSKSNPCIHLYEFFNSSGLKWTRTTDLTLIRRAL